VSNGGDIGEVGEILGRWGRWEIGLWESW